MAHAASSTCPFCNIKILGLSPESKDEATARMNYNYNQHVVVCPKNPSRKQVAVTTQ